MNYRLRLRSALNAAVSLAMVAVLLPSIAPTGRAHASDNLSVVISEINWAGSQSNPKDTWIELYDNTALPIDLAGYKLMSGASTVVDFSQVAPGHTLVQPYHNYLVAEANAVGSSTLGISADMYVANLMPSTTMSYNLVRLSDGNSIDHAGNGQTMPFAGQKTPVVATMVRNFPVADGTMASSWSTSNTVGTGFKYGTLQYGTPANTTVFFAQDVFNKPNQELSQATGIQVSPASPLTTDQAITVTGSYPALQSIYGGGINLYSAQGNEITTVSVIALNPLTHTFTATILPGRIPAGIYRLTVSFNDFIGDRVETQVPIVGSPQNLLVVNSPSDLTVAPPVITSPLASPFYTTAPAVTITGTSSEAGSVVISVNGTDVATSAVAAGNAFTLNANLVPNMLNKVEVRAQVVKNAHVYTSTPVVVKVVHDILVPTVYPANVRVTPGTVGSNDTVSGLAMASDPIAENQSPATAYIYGDAGLISLLGSVAINPDGSFNPVSIGAQKYPIVYLVVRDAAGNSSAGLTVNNGITFTAGQAAVVPSLSFSAIGQNQVTVSWQCVSGASSYHLKYKVANGSYSVPYIPTLPSNSCQATLIGLKSGTNYVLAVSALDRFGNETAYTEGSVKTGVIVASGNTTSTSTAAGIGGSSDTSPIPTPISSASSSNGSSAVTSTGNSAVTTTPSPAPTVAPTVTPTPSPEDGQVKSEDTTSTSKNYTPWIILAILIGLAILATIGYFYWFGGEDEGTVVANPSERNVPPVEDTVGKDTPPVNSSSSGDGSKKNGDREKRW